MSTYIYFILILFYNYFTKIDCKLNNNQQITPKIERPIHPCRCLSHPKVIINPYNKLDVVEWKPMSSICLKCRLCLILAEEVKRTFEEAIQEYPGCKIFKLQEILQEKLEELCSDEFENKLSDHLRNNQEYFIYLNKMGENWIVKLQELCFFYIDHIDIVYLYENYLKEPAFIENYLCRNEGIFRACTNLDIHNNK